MYMCYMHIYIYIYTCTHIICIVILYYIILYTSIYIYIGGPAEVAPQPPRDPGSGGPTHNLICHMSCVNIHIYIYIYVFLQAGSLWCPYFWHIL